jgi:hypothetical protein
LVREGDFWLSMGSGETRTFFMGGTAAERDSVAREFASERIKRKDGESEAAFEKRVDDKLDELEKDGEFEMGDDISSLRSKTYSQGEGKMLTGVFDAIDSTNFADPEAGGLLKDAIYQTFLETMPDQIFRKQFIHRKGIAGFRVDVLQNTAHLSARMATQLARIKYSPLLRNSLSAAKDSIRGRRALEPFVAEMAKRVDSSLAPKTKSVGAAVAGGLNKAVHPPHCCSRLASFRPVCPCWLGTAHSRLLVRWGECSRCGHSLVCTKPMPMGLSLGLPRRYSTPRTQPR